MGRKALLPADLPIPLSQSLLFAGFGSLLAGFSGTNETGRQALQ